MRRLIAALGLLLLAALPASAQMSGVRVVAACGTPSPWPALSGANVGVASAAWLTVDPNYVLCSSSVITGSVTATSSIVSWGGGVLGAMSNYGTSPGAVLVPGVNAFVTNTPTFNLTQVASTVLGAPTAVGTEASGNVVTVNARLTNTSPYPATAVPITASATGTTGATTATLTNVNGHTTYICGFSIRANASAAATSNATVTGTITGTLNFTQWTAPNASAIGVTEEAFVPCIPASAVSVSIAVVSAAPGTGGVVSVTAWGYSI